MDQEEVELRLPTETLTAPSAQILLDLINHDIEDAGYIMVTYGSKMIDGIQAVVRLRCSQQGEPRNTRHLTSETRMRPQRTSRRGGCPMSIQTKLDSAANLWTFRVTKAVHNHPWIVPSAHHINRRLTAVMRAEIFRYASIGTPPRTILASILQQFPDTNLILQDIKNAIAAARAAQCNGLNVADALIQVLEEEEANNFFWRFTQDDRGHIQDFFICSNSAIRIFKQHHDVVILDCTYKTNVYKAPLLHIVGVSGNNTTIKLGVVFLVAENLQHYSWALHCLKEMLQIYEIPPPSAFFTDQEMALVNALNYVFPNVHTILCIWHIFQNVKTYAKKHGNKMADQQTFNTSAEGQRIDIKSFTTAEHEEFMDTFRSCIYSPTEAEFEQKKGQLRRLSSDVTDYLKSQYFDVWKHKFVSCFTNELTLFGIQSTSRGEGAHASMKSFLKTSKCDFYQFWQRMVHIWGLQEVAYVEMQSSATMKVAANLRSHFWDAVNRRIYNFALQQALQQWEKRHNAPPCTGLWRTRMGMPCKHDILRLHERGEILRPNHFHAHYWINRDQAPTSEPRLILPPRSIADIRAELALQRGSHRRGAGTTGNRRIPSAFEQEEAAVPPSTAPAAPQTPQIGEFRQFEIAIHPTFNTFAREALEGARARILAQQEAQCSAQSPQG